MITRKSDLPRKMFTGTYSNCMYEKNKPKKFMLLDIKDEQGVKVKDHFWIEISRCPALIDELKSGDIVEFEATYQKMDGYGLGTKLGTPRKIRKLEDICNS